MLSSSELTSMRPEQDGCDHDYPGQVGDTGVSCGDGQMENRVARRVCLLPVHDEVSFLVIEQGRAALDDTTVALAHVRGHIPLDPDLA